MTLSIATVVKLIRAVVRGLAGEANGTQAVGFLVLMFAMGFLCGVVAWVGRGLYDRIGFVGDSIVGMAVMVVFFLSCMFVFAPDLLGSRFGVGGLPMLALALIVGAICGPCFARDLRKGQ
jgi:hypothetical protein